jgi:hypothetical protein
VPSHVCSVLSRTNVGVLSRLRRGLRPSTGLGNLDGARKEYRLAARRTRTSCEGRIGTRSKTELTIGTTSGPRQAASWSARSESGSKRGEQPLGRHVSHAADCGPRQLLLQVGRVQYACVRATYRSGSIIPSCFRIAITTSAGTNRAVTLSWALSGPPLRRSAPDSSET